MKAKLIAKFVLIIALAASGVAIAQSQVPNTFQSGQPARAAEVNENFDSLGERIHNFRTRIILRAQVLTAIPLASEARYLFAEYFTLRGSFPLDNDAAGAPIASDIQNNFISSVAINGNSVVATFGNNANPQIQNDTLEFIPHVTGDKIYFTCNPTGNVASYISTDSCVFVDEPPEPLTTIRRQVASAISLASEARWLVEDYYKHVGGFPSDNIEAGLAQSPTIFNNYVISVSVDATGITVLFGNDAHASITSESIRFVGNDSGGSFFWECVTPGIHRRYTGPLGCRVPDDLPPQPVTLIRQQLQSGISLAENIQDFVEQFRQANGFWPASNSEAGAPFAGSIRNNYVNSVSIFIGGVITIVYGNNSHTILTGATLKLTPTDNGGSISWGCTGDPIDQYNLIDCR